MEASPPNTWALSAGSGSCSALYTYISLKTLLIAGVKGYGSGTPSLSATPPCTSHGAFVLFSEVQGRAAARALSGDERQPWKNVPEEAVGA